MSSKISINDLKDQNLSNDEIIELLSDILGSDDIHNYEEEIKFLSDKYNDFYSDMPLSMILITDRVRYKIPELIKYFMIMETPYILLHILNVKHNRDDSDILSYYDRINDIFSHIPNKNEIDDIRRKIEDVQREIIEAENKLLNINNNGLETNDQLVRNNQINGKALYTMIRHLDELELEYNEYAPIPDYIRKFDIDVYNLPYYRERILDIKNDSQIIDVMLEDINNAGFIMNDINGREKLINILKNMTEGNKEYFKSQMTVDYEQLIMLRKNKDLTRLYGPVNVRLDDEYKIFDIENLDEYTFGGPRMFLDTKMEYDETTDTGGNDWFTGNCDNCERRIRHFFHAVREPYFSGGWRGCYCSWDCVYNNVTAILRVTVDSEEKESVIDLLTEDTRKNIDVTITLINVYAKWLDEVGIADRDFVTEEEIVYDIQEPFVEDESYVKNPEGDLYGGDEYEQNQLLAINEIDDLYISIPDTYPVIEEYSIIEEDQDVDVDQSGMDSAKDMISNMGKLVIN